MSKKRQRNLLTIHCPYCGKDARVKNGRLFPHVTAGNLRCLGGGSDSRHAHNLNNARKVPAKV